MQKLLSILMVTVFVTGKQNVSGQSLVNAFAINAPTSVVANKVTIDNLGNKIVVGNFSGSNVDFDPSTTSNFLLTSAGDNDFFIAKYSSNGTFINAIRIGSTSTDVATSVTVDNNNNIYVTGWFRGTVDFDPSASVANVVSNGQSGTDLGYNGEVFVAKYNANLQYNWAFNIGGSTVNDAGNRVIITPSGNLAVGGIFAGINVDFNPSSDNFLMSTTNNATEGFFATYTLSGTFLSAVKFGGSSTVDGGVRDIAFDKNGNTFVAGYYTGQIDLDPSSSTFLNTSNGCGDIFLVKLNSSNVFQWGFSVGGSQCDYSTSVAVDTLNNVYLAGTMASQNVDFNPNMGVNLLSTSGFNDAFIAKYNNNGDYQFAFLLGSSSGDDAIYQVIAQDNHITLAGKFFGSFDANPGTGVKTLTSNGNSDIFICRYSLTGSYSDAFSVGSINVDEAYGVVGYNQNFITYVGSFQGTNVQFNPYSLPPQNGTSILSSTGISNAFVCDINFQNTLPASIHTFSAEVLHQSNVKLNWRVSNETNLDRYEVEMSDEGVFKVVGAIRELNKSNYSFNVANLKIGIYLFRLKIIDKDGAISYSKTIKVAIENKVDLVIYPNPTLNGFLTLKSSNIIDGNFSLTISDQAGKNLLSRRVNGNLNNYQLDVRFLTSGTYFLRVVDENKNINSTLKFIKAN